MNFTKKIFFLTITGFIFTGCKDTVKENPKSALETKITAIPTPSESTTIPLKTETTNLTIEGMSCAVMCAAKIEKELAGLEGVQSAKVDFDTKTATVKYDTAKQNPEKLVRTVEHVAGGELYKVSNVKTSNDL